ncbi:hypothetical protein [Actinoplanes sp. L3-i22]|uniref:hypothetical protein n=1 Tax=Actinoplanes sp. L3-i22 TaxID=2836373 RepID=UPI001C861E58|nr:hypothetical protein [Actinoplanes sp. L3-i22]
MILRLGSDKKPGHGSHRRLETATPEIRQRVPVASSDVITQYFPEAAAHLRTAGLAKERLSDLWSGLLSDGLFDTGITTFPDGTGVIVAYADWPASAREQLTAAFKECVDELWACLDALVTESVAMFSIRNRLNDPDAPRFFPIGDSAESFAALLEQSCLDGVLASQFALIRDCQPYQHEPSDARLEKLRTGLRYLVDWSNGLDAGALLAAWATAVDPEIRTEPAATSVRVQPQPPGELADERVVAQYTVEGWSPDITVSGRAGNYIDFAFPDGFVPAGPDDTLDERLRHAMLVVGMFGVAFAKFVEQTPGTRRLPRTDDGDPAGAWIDARRSARRWTQSELDEVAASELGLGVIRDENILTLIVSTPDGTFQRVVPDASPLPQRVARGTAAENAIQDAAATWGLPDFVLRPQQERKGSGLREVGDGLLVVGERGVVVQAKCRDTEPKGPARESAWLDKKIAEAARQADGTVRQLCSQPSRMINGRGRTVAVDGNTISWAAVVVIEHPEPPTDHRIPKIESRIPAVVLLRRDWEFLFNQLRSARAVVDYLHRVGGSTEVLGTEPHRYYELAAADRDAASEPIESVWPADAGERRSVPLLPAAPAGSDDDEAHAMVRIMCEDIATSLLTEQSEQDLLYVLAAIDRLPVGYRTDLGRLLLDSLRTVRDTPPDEIAWRFRTFRTTVPGEIQLGFGVCSQFSEVTREAFRSWFLLRHHERGAIEPLTNLTSVGVMLTPNRTGHRDWDTTMMAITGDPELDPEELAGSQRLWNRPTGT